MKRTQCAEILAYLERGRTITPLLALDRFQCFRLAARISELRDRGHPIKSHKVQLGSKRVAMYSLRA